MPADTKLAGAQAIEMAAADERAGVVLGAAAMVEQAGRGLYKVGVQLSTGVPQGNELYYLIAIQGYINDAMYALVNLDLPPAAPESEGPKLVLG